MRLGPQKNQFEPQAFNNLWEEIPRRDLTEAITLSERFLFYDASVIQELNGIFLLAMLPH